MQINIGNLSRNSGFPTGSVQQNHVIQAPALQTVTSPADPEMRARIDKKKEIRADGPGGGAASPEQIMPRAGHRLSSDRLQSAACKKLLERSKAWGVVLAYLPPKERLRLQALNSSMYKRVMPNLMPHFPFDAFRMESTFAFDLAITWHLQQTGLISQKPTQDEISALNKMPDVVKSSLSLPNNANARPESAILNAYLGYLSFHGLVPHHSLEPGEARHIMENRFPPFQNLFFDPQNIELGAMYLHIGNQVFNASLRHLLNEGGRIETLRLSNEGNILAVKNARQLSVRGIFHDDEKLTGDSDGKIKSRLKAGVDGNLIDPVQAATAYARMGAVVNLLDHQMMAVDVVASKGKDGKERFQVICTPTAEDSDFQPRQVFESRQMEDLPRMRELVGKHCHAMGWKLGATFTGIDLPPQGNNDFAELFNGFALPLLHYRTLLSQPQTTAQDRLRYQQAIQEVRHLAADLLRRNLAWIAPDEMLRQFSRTMMRVTPQAVADLSIGFADALAGFPPAVQEQYSPVLAFCRDYLSMTMQSGIVLEGDPTIVYVASNMLGDAINRIAASARKDAGDEVGNAPVAQEEEDEVIQIDTRTNRQAPGGQSGHATGRQSMPSPAGRHGSGMQQQEARQEAHPVSGDAQISPMRNAGTASAPGERKREVKERAKAIFRIERVERQRHNASGEVNAERQTMQRQPTAPQRRQADQEGSFEDALSRPDGSDASHSGD